MQPQSKSDMNAEPIDKIVTPKDLQKRCLSPGDGSQAARAAINNAEEALKKLSVNFDSWMMLEVGKLKEARAGIKTSGFSTQSVDELFGIAHDMKGQAATFGYPFASDICSSLCKLIDGSSGCAKIPAELLDQHVDAVAAVYREQAKDRDHPKASVLARKLCDVTDDYLNQLRKRSRS
jgi:chemotaxis protein histidine kinase CheA